MSGATYYYLQVAKQPTEQQSKINPLVVEERHYDGESFYKDILNEMNAEAQNYSLHIIASNFIDIFNDGRNTVRFKILTQEERQSWFKTETMVAMTPDELAQNENTFRWKTLQSEVWNYSSTQPKSHENISECWRRTTKYRTINDMGDLAEQVREFGNEYVKVYWINALNRWDPQPADVWEIVARNQMDELESSLEHNLSRKKKSYDSDQKLWQDQKNQNWSKLQEARQAAKGHENEEIYQVNLRAWEDSLTSNLVNLASYKIFKAGALFQFNQIRNLVGLQNLQASDLRESE